MRDVCNGVIWFALISGSYFAVAAQVERPEDLPTPGSAQTAIEGHPSNCLVCRHRGPSLPAEISDETVRIEPGYVVTDADH